MIPSPPSPSRPNPTQPETEGANGIASIHVMDLATLTVVGSWQRIRPSERQRAGVTQHREQLPARVRGALKSWRLECTPASGSERAGQLTRKWARRRGGQSAGGAHPKSALQPSNCESRNQITTTAPLDRCGRSHVSTTSSLSAESDFAAPTRIISDTSDPLRPKQHAPCVRADKESQVTDARGVRHLLKKRAPALVDAPSAPLVACAWEVCRNASHDGANQQRRPSVVAAALAVSAARRRRTAADRCADAPTHRPTLVRRWHYVLARGGARLRQVPNADATDFRSDMPAPKLLLPWRRRAARPSIDRA
jgi:hypothetical protein